MATALAASVDPYMSSSTLVTAEYCATGVPDASACSTDILKATEPCIKLQLCANRAAAGDLETARKDAAEAAARYADASNQYLALLWVCINLVIGIAIFIGIAWVYR
jgi:hypothetical protein